MRLWCDSSVINCDFDWMKLSSFQKKEVQQKRICDALLTGGFRLGGGARSKRDRKPKSPPPSIISYFLVKLDQMTITVSAFSSPGGTERGGLGGGGLLSIRTRAQQREVPRKQLSENKK